MGQGAGVGVGAVYEPRDLGTGLAQIDGHGIAGDGHLGPDGYQFIVEAIVVHQGLPVVNTVGPLRYELPHLPLGGGQYLFHGGQQRAGAVAVQQFGDAFGGDHHRADLGVEVAQEILRLAHVGREHLQDVVPGNAPVIQLQGRDADALLEYLGGPGVIPAVGAAAHVAVMGAVHGVEQQASLVKYGPDDGDVGQVAAAEIGVVQDEQVAFGHGIPEIVPHRRSGHRQGADMHRDALSLGHQLAIGVQDAGGKIAARVKYLGHGGPQHHLGHLQGDGFQTVLHHGQGHRVWAVRCGSCTVRGLPRGLQRDFQLDPAVGVDGRRISRLDQHGGEVRFQYRRAIHQTARRQVPDLVDRRLSPSTQINAAASLLFERFCVSAIQRRRVKFGQTAHNGGPQGHQPDLLLRLTVGVQLPVALVEVRRPLG